MQTITLILETTPDHFGLWLEDATRYAEHFFSTVFEFQPDFARGGFDPSRLRWRWTVEADYYSQASNTFYGPVRLYSFDVISITPSRIKVKAESGELGRDAFDALIARMREELPIVQTVVIKPAQKTEGEAVVTQPTESGLPPEKESRLRDLWADDTWSYDKIGDDLGYDKDTVRKIGYKLKLPKRKPGRKSGK